MIGKPLVSICIPTYNRAKYLSKTLDSIISQEEFQDKKVEIIINDNCSTDNTEDVGKEYATKYENLLYFRNPENVVDRNYPICLSRANGLLRKLNNDTAILLPGSLRDMCEIVEKYQEEKPLIFFDNGTNISDGSAEELNFHDFIMQQGYWVTWIASFSAWDTDCVGIENDTECCDLRLWQVNQECKVGSEKNSVVVLHKKIVETQELEKKNISYGLYKVFYVNFFKILDPYLASDDFSSEDREKLEKDLLYSFFTGWIIKWEMNASNLDYSKEENLKESVFRQYESKPYWKEYLRYYKLKKIQITIKNSARKLLGRK